MSGLPDLSDKRGNQPDSTDFGRVGLKFFGLTFQKYKRDLTSFTITKQLLTIKNLEIFFLRTKKRVDTFDVPFKFNDFSV